MEHKKKICYYLLICMSHNQKKNIIFIFIIFIIYIISKFRIIFFFYSCRITFISIITIFLYIICMKIIEYLYLVLQYIPYQLLNGFNYMYYDPMGDNLHLFLCIVVDYWENVFFCHYEHCLFILFFFIFGLIFFSNCSFLFVFSFFVSFFNIIIIIQMIMI